jgi:dienelactone hydrolase
MVLLVASACQQIGPNPDRATLEGTGPFTVSSYTADGATLGFGSAIVHYPTDVGVPVGILVAMPGFQSAPENLAWMGPRLASHGFAVVTLDEIVGDEFPPARADQLLAAISWIRSEATSPTSPVSGLIDAASIGVAGHSMGGAAALLAAKADPSIKAVLSYAPFSFDPIPGLSTPTLMVACQDDVIAPIDLHAAPLYNGLVGEKMYLEFADAPHDCPVTGSDDLPILGRFSVAWLKYALDGDPRYNTFLCGGTGLTDATVSGFTNTCPVYG